MILSLLPRVSVFDQDELSLSDENISANLSVSHIMREKILLILKEHNKYRAMHNAPHLLPEDSYSYEAQEWIKHSLLLGYLIKRYDSKFGENRWTAKNTSLAQLMNSNSVNPVKMWYDQIENYTGKYSEDTYDYTNRFTQLVWRESRKLGVGISERGTTLYVLCYYVPAGNIHPGESLEETHIAYERNVYVLSLEKRGLTTMPTPI